MRLAMLFLAFVTASSIAAPITVEERSDGAIVSYDPASWHIDGVWVVMDDQVTYSTPQNCTAIGCVKVERWTAQYSCPNRIYARLKVTTFDERGEILLRKKYPALLIPLRDTDTTGLALFRAACGSKRRSG